MFLLLPLNIVIKKVVPSGDESERMQSALNVKHLILKTQMHPYELCGFEFMLKSCLLLEKLTLDISPQVIFEVSKILYISCLSFSLNI